MNTTVYDVGLYDAVGTNYLSLICTFHFKVNIQRLKTEFFVSELSSQIGQDNSGKYKIHF